MMTSTTVIRVKRRLEESPEDTLVLMCKRIKTDKEEISPSLFVFRGTVDSQETTHVKNLLPRTDIKLQSVPNVANIIEKMRKEKKEITNKSRYEVVNCSRGINDDRNDESDDVLNLIDMVKDSDKDDDIQHAYDLYTSWKEDFDISMIDHLVRVETDLVFDTYLNSQQDPSDNEADDDYDSNDENNWRNDYPDSEPSSIDEEDIVRAMKRMDVEDDLSSDTEDVIYDDPPDLSNQDLKKYGEAYAKYKTRVISENPDIENNNFFVQVNLLKHDEYRDDSDDETDDDGFYYGEEEDTDQFKEQYRCDFSSDEYSPD